MTFSYKWYELRNGLLTEPEHEGCYSKDALNPSYGGFDTEEEAVAALKEYKREWRYHTENELILIRLYKDRLTYAGPKCKRAH